MFCIQSWWAFFYRSRISLMCECWSSVQQKAFEQTTTRCCVCHSLAWHRKQMGCASWVREEVKYYLADFWPKNRWFCLCKNTIFRHCWATNIGNPLWIVQTCHCGVICRVIFKIAGLSNKFHAVPATCSWFVLHVTEILVLVTYYFISIFWVFLKK